MNEYLDMWKRYAQFNGVTSVKGYWLAFLINWLITVVLSVLAQYVSFVGIISSLYGLAVLIPSLAILVRRLNDGGKHWANIFWSLLPIIGWIVLIVKLCAPSANQ